MGYCKEIILFRNETSALTAIDILNELTTKNWTLTLYAIDRGDDFDWVEFTSEEELRDALIDKTTHQEYISFSLQHTKTDRFVTIDVNNDKVLFTLDIGRNEDENHWFEWYHHQVVSLFVKHATCVEWRTDYDNRVIRIFESRSL